MYSSRGFEVPACSKKYIRLLASAITPYILKAAEATDMGSINHAQFLEKGIIRFGLELHVLPEGTEDIPLGAPAALVGNELRLRESCYRRICANVGRDLFTLFHELGHFFLCHARQYTRDDLRAHKIYCDSEWQADQFAAEILMPVGTILGKRLTTLEEFQVEFSYVSKLACLCRYERLKKEGII